MMAEPSDSTKPYVLRDDTDYQSAVAEIDRLLDAEPEPASEAHDRLEFLLVLVQAYEDTHCPLDELPTPQAVVDFMLDQHDLSRADLAKWLGSKGRVSEFFRGIRPLSLKQIEALREHLGIPGDLLLGALEDIQRQAPHRGDDLMTYAELLEERGKMRTQVETVDNLLQEGIEWPVIERVTDVNEAQFEELKQRLREIAD